MSKKVTNYPIPTPLDYYKYGDKVIYYANKESQNWLGPKEGRNIKEGMLATVIKDTSMSNLKDINKKALNELKAGIPTELKNVTKGKIVIKLDNEDRIILITEPQYLKLVPPVFRGGKSTRKNKNKKRMTRRRK